VTHQDECTAPIRVEVVVSPPCSYHAVHAEEVAEDTQAAQPCYRDQSRYSQRKAEPPQQSATTTAYTWWDALYGWLAQCCL
jgi:hypothetical protein